MATVNDVANTLNGNFKEVFGDDLQQLTPDGVKVMPEMPFRESEKSGGDFVQAVGLGLEHGITFEEGDQVASMNAPIAGKVEQARAKGYQIVARAQLGWTTISRAISSKRAFRDSTEIVLKNLMLGVKKKSEVITLYGQSGLANIDTVSGTTIINTTVASTAEAHWVGMNGMLIDIYNGSTLVKSGVKIVSVELLSTGAVRLTCDDIGAAANGHTLWYYNSRGKQAQGVHSILSTTGSTLFNIPQTTYPDLWTGNTYGAGGNLTYAKIVKALARGLPKGGEGSFKGYCHHESWQDVVNEVEVASAASFDQRYKPSILERGVDRIKFHTVAGVVELIASAYIKRGDAFLLLQDGSWRRVGSTDITLRVPGMKDAPVFVPLENTAGFQVCVYADFGPFCDKPAGSTYISGITQSA